MNGRPAESSDYRSPLGPRAFYQQPSILGGRAARNYQHRVERVQKMLQGTTRSDFGVVEAESYVQSPITYLLSQRNMLRSRSWLSHRVAARAGRHNYDNPPPPDSVTAMTFDELRSHPELIEGVNISITSDSVSDYGNRLEDGLDKQAADLYTLGRVYFHEREFARAGQQFEMLKVLEETAPRPYIAAALAAVERRDYHTAIANLVEAIERANSLEELLFDRESFYLKAQDFSNALQNLYQSTQSGDSSGHAGLLVAFYAMQRNDMNTAISAVESAENYKRPAPTIASDLAPETTQDPDAATIKRFADWLRAHREKMRVAASPN